ncbi:hypothetical protein D9M73_249710 [compost metagenome]
MVHQFFPGQARHHVDQVDVGMVLGDQAQRGAGGLEFAVLVVDQQGFLVGERRFDPGVWRRAAKKGVDFGDQGHKRATTQNRQGRRLYRRRRAAPVTMLDVHQAPAGKLWL